MTAIIIKTEYMKSARYYITIIITLLLCANTSMAQKLAELQNAIDSLDKHEIYESDYIGYGAEPAPMDDQNKIVQLATDDDLQYIALNAKGPHARAFAYTILVERNSDKCFDILKSLITDTATVVSQAGCIVSHDRLNNYILEVTNSREILDSTQIAYIDSVIIFTPNFPSISYLTEAVEKIAGKPEYYERICQLYDEGHDKILPYIATYHNEKDIDKIISALNEYKNSGINSQYSLYDYFMESGNEEDAEEIKPDQPRQKDRSYEAIMAIQVWQHPDFVSPLTDYINSCHYSGNLHYVDNAANVMDILMNYNDDWAYKMIERYLKLPTQEYYIAYFEDVYKSHENKERFQPLYEKYCPQSLSTYVVSTSFVNGVEHTDTLYYTFDDKKKEATVVATELYIDDAHIYSGDIIIPSTITHNGTTYTVTCIGERAFGDSEITSVQLPESLRTIEDNAFSACLKLASVTFPDGLSSIGNQAFYACHNLTSIVIPRSLRQFKGGAFMYCPITSITVDKENPVYDSRNNCNAIIETSTNKLVMGCPATVIPDNITIIGEMAFHGSKITTLTLPETVKEIESYAFSNCDTLTAIHIPDNVRRIGDHAFRYCNSLKSITLPSRLKKIEEGTFEDCRSLTSIIIPDAVTKIEEEAFSNCESLTSIHIGKSFSTYNDYPFGFKVPDLMRITIDKGNKVFDSRDNCNAIIRTSTNELLFACNATTIPNTVTKLGDCAFWGVPKIKTLVIPESVKTIGETTFSCDSLISITLPASLKNIGENAFEGCRILKHVTNLSPTPQKIGKGTFSMIELKKDETSPFSQKRKKVKREIFLHVLKGCKEKYAKAEFWKEFTIIEDAEAQQESR